MASRRAHRLVLIDIAVPRDVEATTASLPDVTLYDIDDLEQVAGANLNGRHREAERAEGIIREELSHFRAWRRAAAAAPVVRALWSWAESIRQSELAEIEARSTSLTPEARRQLDAVTRSLVKKLLHEPTLRLRAPDNRDNGLRHLESLRYLFGLAEGQDAAGGRAAVRTRGVVTQTSHEREQSESCRP